MTAAAAAWSYACPLDAGRLLLSVPPPGTPPDAVAQAQLLAACEPLLRALEAWWGIGLDPQPEPADADGIAQPATFTVAVAAADPPAAPAGTRLTLPLAWLARQPAPPPGLLHWPALQLSVELASFPPGAVPADGLEAGGALLLPGAFEARWPLRLVAPLHGLAWPASWRGPGSPIGLAGAQPLPALPPQPEAAWQVLLDGDWALPMERLLGWQRPHADALETEAPPAAFEGRARLRGAGIEVAGRIVPMLQGAALLIEPQARCGQEPAAWT